LKLIAKSLLAALLIASSAWVLPSTAPAFAADDTLAAIALERLPVKGKAQKTGYEMSLFSDGWGQINGCTVRNFILIRDLKSVTYRSSCVVNTGVLNDPYTKKIINFRYGVKTSSAVQIDHVVALSDAWQKGAQSLNSNQRYGLYNDPLNLLAVDGPTNASKGDKDAASWLPPNKSYRCAFVARQIAVKLKYKLWLVSAEKTTMNQVLSTCPKQKLPTR